MSDDDFPVGRIIRDDEMWNGEPRSLRDAFAMVALRVTWGGNFTYDEVADKAYLMADAMMRRRVSDSYTNEVRP